MTTWATPILQRLRTDGRVTFRPRGNSMTPRIKSGQEVTVVTPEALGRPIAVGDVALCTVGGKVYLHLVTALDGNGRLQISNNRGHVNGWTHAVHGVMIEP